MLIKKQLDNYIKEDIYPFHMPGHKRNKDFMFDNMLQYDLTEIKETDNLHKPESFILEAQKKAATIFGSSESFFAVNGSSGGIMSAIMSVCNNEPILICRNSHRSVYNGVALCGGSPIYILPELMDNGIIGGVSPKKIEDCLCKHNDISAVVITSPTYEGIVSDIKTIADVTHKYKKILIVDEAHGAHFNFSDYFPKSAVLNNADIVIQSLHKTLPALNQSAIVHVNGNLVDRDKLKHMISMLQTTSPSFLMLTYADYFLQKLYNNKNVFKDYVALNKKYREKFAHLKSVTLFNEELIGNNNIFDIDKGKLVFYNNIIGLNGYIIDDILRKQFKVQVELSSEKYIIAMTSCCDIELGYERLLNGLTYIEENYNNYYTKEKININWQIPKMIYTPREMLGKHKLLVNLEDSVGKVCANDITPYPPGIPLIVSGEEITKEIIHQIIYYLETGVTLIGEDSLKDKKISILGD